MAMAANLKLGWIAVLTAPVWGLSASQVERIMSIVDESPTAPDASEIQVVTYKQAALRMGVSQIYVGHLVREGKLEAVKPRGHQRAIGVTAKSLNNYLKGDSK